MWTSGRAYEQAGGPADGRATEPAGRTDQTDGPAARLSGGRPG